MTSFLIIVFSLFVFSIFASIILSFNLVSTHFNNSLVCAAVFVIFWPSRTLVLLNVLMYSLIVSLPEILPIDMVFVCLNIVPIVDRIEVICFVSSSVNDAVPDASVKYASRNQTSLVGVKFLMSILNDAFISANVLPVYEV